MNRARHSGGYNSIRLSKDMTLKDQEPNQILNLKKFDVDVFESFLNEYECNMNKQKYDLQSYKRTEDSQYIMNTDNKITKPHENVIRSNRDSFLPNIRQDKVEMEKTD
jgi:hypothetical protein